MNREEQMRRPVFDMLSGAAGRYSMHMPGHGGMPPFPGDGSLNGMYALDTTELPLTDDLHTPQGAILEAERLYATCAGSAETIFLHNGSTAGIHVMLQMWAREHDTVILPRNAHLSASAACVLGGLRAVWIPCRETRDGYVYVHEEDVLRTVLEHPEAKTLLLTRPDYYGGCIPLRRIVETCHGMGIRVAVDEAHGAHFPWSHEMQSAGCFSVDAWVQSCHKTLPALTGSAVLHLRDSEDLGRAMRILRREETSSPSFLLVMSIDDARAYMEKTGGRAVEGTEQRIREGLRKWIRAGFCDPRTSWAQETGYTYDPARLVLRGRMPGQELQERLAENGVDVEMADTREVVMIPPLGAFDRDDFWKALDVAVMKAGKSQAMDAPPHSESHMVPLPECRLTMRAAEMADHEVVPLKKAAGRTSAVSAGLYPPGIPMVVPGEVISSEISELLNEAGAGRRFGVDREDGICVVV